jgi:simple sugar transport system substrate-binding protein
MRRLLLVLVVVFAGCGGTTVVREQGVTVSGSPTTAPVPGAPVPDGAVRIAVVTHGPASSKFWAIIRNGVDSAARRLDVLVDYRSPDVYSLEKMSTLIDQAVLTKPDGLVVSIPERGLAPAIRRAVRAGIPVVSINSGSDVFKSLGVLAHVGQLEDRAGFEAGRRLADAGVRRAICINQQVGNTGLDARCAGLARAMRDAGGTSRVLAIVDDDPGTPRRIARTVEADGAQGVLTTNSLGGLAAAEGLAGSGVKIGTFDLGPDVLKAVLDGRITFAVDQQAYLQGYLPIEMLALRARYGILPAQHDVVATGPNFVTRSNAAQALELSERSIR